MFLRTSFAQHVLALGFASVLTAPLLYAQDGVHHLEASRGGDTDRTRVAVADFKPGNADAKTPAFKRAFDATLYNDLSNAGIFDMVSKAMNPQAMPGLQNEINIAQWAGSPTSAAMVAFGSLSTQNDRIIVNGFLDDAKNTQYPQIFVKQYNEEANEDSARQIAHRFADEIITRLGGGVAGIAETKIYYVKIAENQKEIWEMDYDGANQHPVTHLGTVSISPRVSPDNSRLAFSSLGRDGFQIKVYSLILGRLVNFADAGSMNISPAWAPDGQHLAFSSSRGGDPDIWISEADGRGAHKVTSFKGPDSSPVWNPRTGSQIAWISGRSGLPQLYTMDADGSGVQRLTDGGYATSPSWSPNGQFVAFAWDRKYGPGAPGGQDIYVMDVATHNWHQYTHDEGRCDFPSWAPDGRHIVYANSPDGRPGHTRIMSIDIENVANKRALTTSGGDMPNWSWR